MMSHYGKQFAGCSGTGDATPRAEAVARTRVPAPKVKAKLTASSAEAAPPPSRDPANVG